MDFFYKLVYQLLSRLFQFLLYLAKILGDFFYGNVSVIIYVCVVKELVRYATHMRCDNVASNSETSSIAWSRAVEILCKTCPTGTFSFRTS